MPLRARRSETVLQFLERTKPGEPFRGHGQAAQSLRLLEAFSFELKRFCCLSCQFERQVEQLVAAIRPRSAHDSRAVCRQAFARGH